MGLGPASFRRIDLSLLSQPVDLLGLAIGEREYGAP